MKTLKPPTPMWLFTTLCALCLVACGSPGTVQNEGSVSPWGNLRFEPPMPPSTEYLVLEPLAPRHAALDYAALMGSREHLQHSLHWGDWPRADFTLAENRTDLERHWREYVWREAYAYTVLSPDRSTCLGCVYLVGLPRDEPQADQAALSWWVIEAELADDLDRHLLATLLEWFDNDWPFERVLVPLHLDNERGADLARELGLEQLPEPPLPEHLAFTWQR